jgi:hypothetical protein
MIRWFSSLSVCVNLFLFLLRDEDVKQESIQRMYPGYDLSKIFVEVFHFSWCWYELSQYSCGLDGQALILSRDKIFLCFTVSRLALGPTQPPIEWVVEAVYPRVKRPGHEADHSPPSSAEVRNDGAIPPLPHTFSWHGA